MKQWLTYLFICFSIIAFGQNPKVTLTVSPTEVSVGQPVKVTITSTVEGDLVDNFPNTFVPGYGVERYSSYQQDVNTGKMIQEHVVSVTGAFSKDGIFTLGPFYVKAGNKSYPSNKISVTVNKGPIVATDDFSQKQLSQPAFGIIERNADKIYEGQALVLNARVFSTFEPTGRPLMKKYYEVDGVVDVHHIDAGDRIYMEKIDVKGKQYTTFSFDKQIVFPTTTGKLSLNSFDIVLPYGGSGYEVVSNVPSIDVVPLPNNPPKEFIGAVGNFDVKQNVAIKDLKQGDVFQLDVIVEGEGNLHNIEQPKLPLNKGMVVYGDPTVEENWVVGSHGTKGTITYKFNVQVTKEGAQAIPGVAIGYFDPKQEKYVTKIADSTIYINVKKNPKFQSLDSEDDVIVAVDELAPLAKATASKSPFFWISTIIYWIAFSTPILALLFFGFVKKNSASEVSKKEQRQMVSSIKQTSTDALQEAEISLAQNDTDKFYTNLNKGLTNSIIAHCGLNPETVYLKNDLIEALRSKNASDNVIATAKMIFSACDAAKYGIAPSNEEQHDLLNDSKELIKQLK